MSPSVMNDQHFLQLGPRAPAWMKKISKGKSRDYSALNLFFLMFTTSSVEIA